MPTSQVIVPKNSLTVVDESKISTVVLGVVEDVDESLVTKLDPNFKSVPPSFGNRRGSFRKNCRGRLSNSVLKLRKLLFRIHGLWPWLGLIKFSHRSQKVFFFHMPGFPLHEVAFDLVGVFVRNFALLPGLGKVGEGEPVLRLKVAERFITGSKLVLKAFSSQVFQFRFQIRPWGEIFEHPEEFVAERYN